MDQWKNPKKTKLKQEEEEDDWLDDLVMETDPNKRQNELLELGTGRFCD